MEMTSLINPKSKPGNRLCDHTTSNYIGQEKGEVSCYREVKNCLVFCGTGNSVLLKRWSQKNTVNFSCQMRKGPNGNLLSETNKTW